MQVVDANTLVGSSVEGVRGSLTVMPGFTDERFGAQIVVVPPMTKAPKAGFHLSDRTFLFVLQGSATLSNGEYYQKVTPGKMVLLEAGEERMFQTEREKLVCLEVRLGPAPPPPPATVQNVVYEAPPTADEPTKPSTALYDEV